jgi:RNA polymerase sigma-70 factor (ECF subfamily)
MGSSALARQVSEAVASGDPARAATAVLRALGPQILGYFHRILRDADDADDAFACFAENVWSGIGSFRGEASLDTWCYRVAWHAALRVLRDPHRRRCERLETTEAARLAAEVRSTTASHLGTTAQERIARLRQALSPEEQTLLMLRVDRGLPWREVALVMGEDGVDVSEAALRKRYERIKERVRELAAAEGLLPARAR